MVLSIFGKPMPELIAPNNAITISRHKIPAPYLLNLFCELIDVY